MQRMVTGMRKSCCSTYGCYTLILSLTLTSITSNTISATSLSTSKRSRAEIPMTLLSLASYKPFSVGIRVRGRKPNTRASNYPRRMEHLQNSEICPNHVHTLFAISVYSVILHLGRGIRIAPHALLLQSASLRASPSVRE